MRNNKRRFKRNQSNSKPQKPKFQIVVMTAVWAMIIFMILGVVLPAISQLFMQYF